jgi:hypothetical protein
VDDWVDGCKFGVEEEGDGGGEGILEEKWSRWGRRRPRLNRLRNGWRRRRIPW